ncbi:biotin-dependent carboxyltransferase family protein [Fredinandcohnia sp. QZ13]|uniref:5-oxoprolinase subunit C family protein n=1 Tax=Fredinandcohnia sp. QZ13 TaxID=3073144 RepID=UPI0028533996|nr:biotin-dependent carboxyltransferase family protein [Fredinandcohnia sp. QZ13]MDR4890297.1 biotin-dependent carboxyltransferase family protein [Fredinandcohnia sp. QZ13]
MGQPLFTVLKKGLYTTFQDLGRYGYQQFGVVTSGAMDSYSSQLANILVGNPRGEAVLEITMIGPTLLVEADTISIAVCGADLSMTVNGNKAPLWKSFIVKKGDIIRFGKPVSGTRTYLAAAGGFHAEEVLGSKSYYPKAKLGTEINDGDILYGTRSRFRKNTGLSRHFIPTFEKEITVRAILGPHDNYFTEDAIEKFFTDLYRVVQGDRMGYRLQGTTPLQHKDKAEIPSDAIPLGGIQVPSSGEPIILLADRQTTGGYPRIATVISVDIYKIAQLAPGGKIRFEHCRIETAHELYKKREKFLENLQG